MLLYDQNVGVMISKTIEAFSAMLSIDLFLIVLIKPWLTMSSSINKMVFLCHHKLFIFIKLMEKWKWCN